MATAYDHTLAGGHPALDFVNSVDDWTAPAPRDYLRDFGDAVRFGEAVGVLSRGEAQRLAGPGARGLGRAAAELAALRRLRASLQRILHAAFTHGRAPAADVAVLRGNLVDSARGVALATAADRPLVRTIPVESNGPAALRFRIVDRAVDLLVSDAMTSVKACPACGWFFLDVSKNHSRVWCSMDTCGARAKARRYYLRTKRRSSVRTRPARSQP